MTDKLPCNDSTPFKYELLICQKRTEAGRATLIRHALRARHLPPGEGEGLVFLVNRKSFWYQYVFRVRITKNTPRTCLPLGEGADKLLRREADEGHPAQFCSFPSDRQTQRRMKQ